MRDLLVSFACAALFGCGLVVAGMTQPKKVIGFLDIFGTWDPSLLFVMIGAIAVHAISYRFIAKRKSPLLSAHFHLPTRKDVDWKLLLGSAVFGVGWGLGGFCPGPALVGLASKQRPVLIFVICMIGGIYAYSLFEKKFLLKRLG